MKPSSFQAEHLNPPVLPKMMIKRERPRHESGVEHGGGRRESPVENGVLIPGAGRFATASARASETEEWMVVGKVRNLRGRAATRAGVKRRGWNEPASASTNARKVAPLNQPPDGRP